jgi:hypothetical protein
MTEAEWACCTTPPRMLDQLQGPRWNAKRRRFAVACCRAVPELLDHPWVLRGITAAEEYLDGRRSKADMTEVSEGARAAALGSVGPPGPFHIARDLTRASARDAAWYVSFDALAQAVRNHKGYHARRDAEWRKQADLLREIVGNPFRPVALDPGWVATRGGMVARLARAIHQDGRFEEVPVLADALEEARCPCEELLAHCRRREGHVRGCWAVELLARQP